MKHSAFEDFNESAQEALDFARCQRPDGSFYGTGGVCRKGTPTGAKEKDAVAPAPPKSAMTKKDSVAGVLKEQAATKAFLKEDSARMAKGNPKLVVASTKAKVQKLGDEYERLRGDASAAGRRKEIMSQVNKLIKARNEAQRRMDDAAKSQSPARAADTSLPAQLRRSSAAARARD